MILISSRPSASRDRVFSFAQARTAAAATFAIALGLASVMLGAAGQMINTAAVLLTGRINSILRCVAARGDGVGSQFDAR